MKTVKASHRFGDYGKPDAKPKEQTDEPIGPMLQRVLADLARMPLKRMEGPRFPGGVCNTPIIGAIHTFDGNERSIFSGIFQVPEGETPQAFYFECTPDGNRAQALTDAMRSNEALQ